MTDDPRLALLQGAEKTLKAAADETAAKATTRTPGAPASSIDESVAAFYADLGNA